MSSVILQAESLNLPESIAVKFKGKKVELTEDDGIVTIKPIKINDSDCTVGLIGMLAGNSEMTVNKFLDRKRADKELE